MTLRLCDTQWPNSGLFLQNALVEYIGVYSDTNNRGFSYSVIRLIGLSQRECPLWSKAYQDAYQFLLRKCGSSNHGRGSTINSQLLIRGRSMINSQLLIRSGSMINSQLLIRGRSMINTVDPPGSTVDSVDHWSGADQWSTVNCWSGADQWSTVNCWSGVDQWSTVNCWSGVDQWSTVNCWSGVDQWSTLLIPPGSTVDSVDHWSGGRSMINSQLLIRGRSMINSQLLIRGGSMINTVDPP